MKKFLLWASIALPLFSFAQESTSLKGKNIKDVQVYLNSMHYPYTIDTNIAQGESIIEALIEKNYWGEDSSIITSTILKLKFHSDQICYYSNRIHEREEKNILIASSKAQNTVNNNNNNYQVGDFLEKAGATANLGNVFSIIGPSIMVLGLSSSDPASYIFTATLGGSISIIGVVLNFVAWNQISKAGLLMKQK